MHLDVEKARPELERVRKTAEANVMDIGKASTGKPHNPPVGGKLPDGFTVSFSVELYPDNRRVRHLSLGHASKQQVPPEIMRSVCTIMGFTDHRFITTNLTGNGAITHAYAPEDGRWDIVEEVIQALTMMTKMRGGSVN